LKPLLGTISNRGILPILRSVAISGEIEALGGFTFPSHWPFPYELDKAGNLSDMRRSDDSYPDQSRTWLSTQRRQISSLFVQLTATVNHIFPVLDKGGEGDHLECLRTHNTYHS
ncbi:hypothetical protein ATANTOWER_021294, partial [Ataeniobius toweri]|nr:hypothetical protein [Ataeniobius toweri]